MEQLARRAGKVQKVPGITAAAPYINFTGLVESGANLRAIRVKGVDPQQEQRLSALPSFVLNNARPALRPESNRSSLAKASPMR